MIWTNPVATHIITLVVGLATGWGIRWWTTSNSKQSEKPSPIAQTKNQSSPEQLSEKLQELELAYRMAVEMAQYKAGFLARTSHELRSPLNSIMSLQQLILTDLCDSPEEEREFVSQSYAAAQKLLALLNETTNASKLEEGTIELQNERLSLAELLSELESLTHLHAQNRNLKLLIKPPSPDIDVVGDRRWLRQILMHLVTTAIYQMDAGTIQVTAQVDEKAGKALIWVEDERPRAAWSEAVDLLKQASSPEFPPTNPLHISASNPSNGLSLTITQILMEKMNGDVSLLSAPTPETEKEAPMPSQSSQLSTQFHTCVQCSIPLAS